MKNIMISIQPEYCELIASGKKTIEVRKTAPKAPFREFIYCTKDKWQHLVQMPDKTYRIYSGREYGSYDKNLKFKSESNGKVIGEFICDKVICLTYETKIPTVKQNEDGTLSIVGYTTTEPFYNGKLSTIKGSCLEQKQLLSYGKGKTLYGLHITALKVYDKPRELGEFLCLPKRCRAGCTEIDAMWMCPNCKMLSINRPITRPPQSWMYCEPPKDMEDKL